MCGFDFPVFLLDGGDVTVLNAPVDVERELEPFLADEPVEFFDALGRRLQLVVERIVNRPTIMAVDRCTVRLAATSDERSEEHLRQALVTYLEGTGRPVPVESTFSDFTAAVGRLIS